MQSYALIFSSIMPLFIGIGLGFLLRKASWLNAEADKVLLRISINLFLPCLMLDSLIGNHELRRWDLLVLGPLVGFGTTALGLACSWLAAPWFTPKTPKARGTFAFSVGVANYGNVGILLAAALFPAPTLGVLFVCNLGAELAFWTLALMLIQEGPWRQQVRKAFNLPVVSILAGLALNFAGASAWLPSWFFGTCKVMGGGLLPVLFLLIGATLADELGSLRLSREGRVMTGACLVRLGVIPILFLALAWILPLEERLKEILVIYAACPCAVMPIVLVKHHQGHMPTALCAFVSIYIGAFVSIPFWMGFGLNHILAGP